MRKFFAFFSIFLLASLLLGTPTQSYAAFTSKTVNCQGKYKGIEFTYDFTPPLMTTQDPSQGTIGITINTNSNLPEDGSKYILVISDGKDWLGGVGSNSQAKTYTGVANNGVLVFSDATSFTTNHDYFAPGTTTITLWPDNTIKLPNSILCQDSFQVIAPQDSQNPNGSTCRIDDKTGWKTDFKPPSGVRFQVTGLTTDSNVKRGMVLVPADKNGTPTGEDDVANTCASDPELGSTNGWAFPTVNQNRVASGYYDVVMTDHCTFWGTSEGAQICDTPQLIKMDQNGILDPNCKPDPNNNTCGDGGPKGPVRENCSNKPCPSDTNQICDLHDNTCKNSPILTLVCDKQTNNENNYSCPGVKSGLGGIIIPTDPQGFIAFLLGLLFSVIGGIMLVIIIATGYRLMASQGDAEKVKEAREGLTSAIVGLLFIIFSLVILQLITHDILKIPGFG